MMVSYKLFVLCVIFCTVHSYNITGSIRHNNGAVSKVKLSNYIDGETWNNTRDLTLDKLVDTETLPTLTIVNFKSISSIHLKNIALEIVPVFLNTSFTNIVITGNRIKSIPASAFRGPLPMRLDLGFNEIQSMANRSVHVGVTYVRLNCNKLSNFSQSWFEEPESVRHLHLRGNLIEYIQDHAFNQMTQLRELELSYNRITSIGIQTFGSGILELYLHFNAITKLTSDMFGSREEPMFKLFLHHNQLSYLTEALLVKLKPKAISLVGNPWQCQCLRDLEGWLRELNSSRRDIPPRRGEPVCVVPLSFQNACIPVVDTELQQRYASALSPLQGCWASGCLCAVHDALLAVAS